MNKKLSVLIVDDSLLIRKQLRSILEKLEIKVLGDAKDATEAIQLYRQLKPDFVTMDITLDKIDGIEAVKRIKKIDPEAKIIMVTSYGQEEKVFKSIKAGAKSYLLKPIIVEKLVSILDKLFPEYMERRVRKENNERAEAKRASKFTTLKNSDE
ncbi:MAG: response regulator [Helicobacteraceae bacterium]|nr:response regulator [Helicobacteraceae bacterium]